MNALSTPIRAVAAVCAAAVLSVVLVACGSDTTGPDAPVMTPLDGLWRATEAGVLETTIKLGTDGSAHLVEADFAGLSCTSAAGSWSSDEDRLVLRLTPAGGAANSDVRSYDVEVSQGRLVLTRSGESTTFVSAPAVPSCVSYGFGSWQGTLSARIGDVPWTFTNITIDTERIQAGSLVILACLDTATSCTTDNVVLLLQVNGVAGPLTPGTYPLGDISSGFYGLVNLFPDDPDFPGFDSLRLTPTGALVLTSITDERIVATFEFRANERASNAPPAPDGSTFALVTNGVIDLEYR